MKVILINGSPDPKGCTFTALSEVSAQLAKNGLETEIFNIGNAAIAGCLGCRKCRETGKCVYKGDSVEKFLEKAVDAYGFVFGSPVYYAGMSGQLKCFMDRAFFSSGKTMANKPAAAVVSCRRGGASTAFDQINKYFQINNMPVVSSKYWNQVHGQRPEEVLKDAEGLQTMRTLADNMAWLIKCIAQAKLSGINIPEREIPIQTDFIRS